MVELNSDEETYLSELLDCEQRGGDVEKFISYRLYEELSHRVGQTSVGQEIREYEPDYHRVRAVYESLADKGMLKATHPMSAVVYRFHGLTSDGRCYIRDKADAERRRREQIMSDRRFQIGLSVATLVLSALLGAFTGWVSSQTASDEPIRVEVI